jgi:2-C-methyl-D-erythritol 4-phosphate cytidylyltransferase
MIKFGCIILAAGNGLRFGEKKQFIEWKGKPLWKHVFEKCSAVSDNVIVVGVDIAGGTTRQESVLNGLQHITYDTVVIVEATRPAVTSEQIKFIASKCTKENPSVSYALPNTSTIYKNGYGHFIRDGSYLLQVPQAFKTELLQFCYEACDYKNYTSDTQIIEFVRQIHPLLIEGNSNLWKITYKHDLKILDVIINESK